MIKPRSTEEKFNCLDLMLDAVIKPHHSHESRNAQLSVIRAIIDDWAKEFSRYISEDDRKTQAAQTLDAVYYLCIWQLDGETHTCVRQRLYLAQAVILQYRRRVFEVNEEKVAGYRRQTLSYVDMPEKPEPEAIPEEALILVDNSQELPF